MNLSPNMAGAFATARPQAQHCDDLIRTGPRPEERAENLAAWQRDIARELSQDLSELLSGAKLTVELTAPETMAGSDVLARIGPIAANSLLRCGQDDHTLLLSYDFATAIALTDRSFGGDGRASEDDLPEQLPRSAAMLTDTAAKIIAQTIARVSMEGQAGSSSGPGNGGAVRSIKADVIVRSESAGRLKPFDQDTPCAVFTLECREENASGEPLIWKALIALPEQRLDRLLPGAASNDARSDTAAKRRGGNDAPFAHIPLSIEAVLAEFDLSLTRLERLRPGDQIPFAMPREVPLRMGEDVLAHGSLGTIDNQMAVRLTRFHRSGVAA